MSGNGSSGNKFSGSRLCSGRIFSSSRSSDNRLSGSWVTILYTYMWDLGPSGETGHIYS